MNKKIEELKELVSAQAADEIEEQERAKKRANLRTQSNDTRDMRESDRTYIQRDWNLGDDFGNGEADDFGKERSTVEPSRGRYRPNRELAGSVSTDGFQFTVAKFSNPDIPEYCQYCNAVIPLEYDKYPCEFGPIGPTYNVKDGYRGSAWVGPTTVREAYGLDSAPARGGTSFRLQPDKEPAKCRCNGCERSRLGDRKQGGQAKICGSDDCKKALKRDQNRRAYQKRKAKKQAQTSK